MNKIEKDGYIAVLTSPGYGAGWSTWNHAKHAETLLMDAEIVQFVLDGDIPGLEAYITTRFGEEVIYTGGLDQILVEWVPKGAQFEVTEYDGSEYLHIIGERQYFTA